MLMDLDNFNRGCCLNYWSKQVLQQIVEIYNINRAVEIDKRDWKQADRQRCSAEHEEGAGSNHWQEWNDLAGNFFEMFPNLNIIN